MSLVSGPGRAKLNADHNAHELSLHVEKHVRYIQSLDTVCPQVPPGRARMAHPLIAQRRAGVLADRTPASQWALLGSDGVAFTWPC